MKIKTLSSGLAFLAAQPIAWAMSITEMPMPRAESTSVPVIKTLPPDPWTCVTENITQYFDVPKPTGTLLDALISYGDELLKPCLSTATGTDVLYCSVSETTKWCGFTTAAPSSVLSDYSSYGSAAASFWHAKSRTMSIIASDCPVGWSKPGPIEQTWLNQTIAHGECYIDAHPGDFTTTTSATSTAKTGQTATNPTPTNSGIVGRNQGVDAFMLASTGVAAAVNAMW
ncbi:hypothetical protein F5Y04DRAFT_246248 [Hypomontagnella monticulosa]|nr:hypothetical protein F5Y04DRAFT_246248 [Hypomontagnella monticulosa]